MYKIANFTKVNETRTVSDVTRVQRNGDVIDKFLSWDTDAYSTANQWTYKDMLFSYNTLIAVIGEGKDLYVTSTKYSTTTSKLQGQMKRQAEMDAFNIHVIDQKELEEMVETRFQPIV